MGACKKRMAHQAALGLAPLPSGGAPPLHVQEVLVAASLGHTALRPTSVTNRDLIWSVRWPFWWCGPALAALHATRRLVRQPQAQLRQCLPFSLRLARVRLPFLRGSVVLHLRKSKSGASMKRACGHWCTWQGFEPATRWPRADCLPVPLRPARMQPIIVQC